MKGETNMKFFEDPKMEVVKFAVADVITTSEVEEEPALFDETCF